MTKTKVALLVLVFLGLLSAAFFFQLHNSSLSTDLDDAKNRQPEQVSNSTETQYTVEKIFPTAPLDAATQIETDKNIKPSHISYHATLNLPYRVDYQSGLGDTVAKMISLMREDNSGVPEYKLFQINRYCKEVLTEKYDIENTIAELQNNALESGLGNGYLIKLRGFQENKSQQCQDAQSYLATVDANGLLYDSALSLNNRRAQAEFGLQSPAIFEQDFSKWPKERQEEFRLFKGDLLLRARVNCEPAAFRALGDQKNWGEGENWTLRLEAGISNDLVELDNLYSLIKYNELKTRDYQPPRWIIKRISEIGSTLDDLELQRSIENSATNFVLTNCN